MINKFLNKIIKGDCLEVLKKIPDNSVDMTFADPPFNLKKNIKMVKETKINGYFVSVYLGHIRTMRNKDFKEIWKNKGDLKLLDKKKFYEVELRKAS